MNSILIAIAIVVLALGIVLWGYFFVIKPWNYIRAALHRLASGNRNVILSPGPPRILKSSIQDIQKISELLQQRDRQIAEEEFNLQAILSSMVEGVLIVDRSQRIRLVNKALMALFAMEEPPINRTVLEAFRKHELQNALDAGLESRILKKIELIFEVPTSTNSYELKHFEIHIASLTPESSLLPTAALIVFHDVTVVRSLEAARKEFLANISHEFRTPLAIINGYVETLLDGALNEPAMAERSLQVMHKNGQRLSLLIDDLLTISRLEDGAKLLDLHTVNLKDLLNRVLEDLEPNIQQHGAHIEIDWAEDACNAQADSRRIEQVYSNLLGNSLRYGDVENLIIRISANRKNNEICIAFADNGPGIPLRDQTHIFERFYRVHKDRSRDAGGTGLGLSIVKNVIQAHGGRVSIESTPGAGATFHIVLPA